MAVIGPLIGLAGVVLVAMLDNPPPQMLKEGFGLRGPFVRWALYEFAWVAGVAIVSQGRWWSVSLRPLWLL